MKRTKVDETLAAAAEAHEGDAERVLVLERARRFKSSWLELAEALTGVRRTGAWKRWGYDSFEAYTKTELHLKAETVEKLTGSFAFLQKRAPEVLTRDGVSAPIPSYQSVDFLRRAEAESAAPADVVDTVRRRVLDEGANASAVSREYKDVVFPIDEATRKERDAAGVRNVAARLRALLAETSAVPKRVAKEVTVALDGLLAALDEREERAA